MTKWQPIETAPRDGTQILASDGRDMVVVEFYQAKDGSAFWEIAHNENSRFFSGRYLTHWMHLPEPPGKAA